MFRLHPLQVGLYEDSYKRWIKSIEKVAKETKGVDNRTYLVCPTCEDKLCWYDNRNSQQVFGCYQCETVL